jgi:transketolase
MPHSVDAMRKTCLEMVHKLAKSDSRVVFIGSDLSPGLLDDMKAEMPDRHYMEGIMEANVIGMAAGMALDGYMPFVNTIATFITRRCYEQVALDLCLHDLPVRLIGNGGGLVYAPLGPTHLAIEDMAIMRALPNMTVTAVADADEMTRLMEASLDWPHPIYIRLAKGGDPIVSDAARGFEIGKAIAMRETGADDGVLIIATGVMTNRALAAADILEADGIGCAVLHVHTVKPLDYEAVLAMAARARLVVIAEEHTVIGGLGSAVTDLLVEKFPAPLTIIRRFGIPDCFPENYGVQDDLLEIYGLQPAQIARRIIEILT